MTARDRFCAAWGRLLDWLLATDDVDREIRTVARRRRRIVRHERTTT